MADIDLTESGFIPGANAVIKTRQKAGATITQGQVVYQDRNDANKWKLGDANASAVTAGNGTLVGLACQSVASGQYFDVLLEDDDLTIGGTVLTANTAYILSATAGGIAPLADLTTGWYLTLLGVAKSTTKLNFRPIKSGVAS